MKKLVLIISLVIFGVYFKSIRGENRAVKGTAKNNKKLPKTKESGKTEDPSEGIVCSDRLIVTQEGNVTATRAEQDFASHMGEKSSHLNSLKDKASSLQLLDKLISGSDCDVKGQTDAFNFLLYTKLIPLQEKIKWIKKNIRNLIPPFYWLNAEFLLADNKKTESFHWHYCGTIAIVKDLNKCSDETVSGALEIMQKFFYETFQLFAKDIKSAQKKKEHIKRLVMENTEKVLGLFKSNPMNRKKPYWLSNHGMKHLNFLMLGKKGKETPFTPEKTWPTDDEIMKRYRDDLKKHEASKAANQKP